MDKISIVVPIYNPGKKLKKCIKSIINQTYNDLEVILVNDGSTDGSLEICEHFSKLDSRIIIINKENEGCIITRRKGIEVSSGEYVLFVDSDDWIHNDFVKTLYEESIKNNLDITICNMYKTIGNGYLIKEKNNSKYFKEDKIYERKEIKDVLISAYFHGHPFPSSLSAKLYKKDLLMNTGGYLNRINFLGEDLYLNLEVLFKASRIKIIDKPMYYYRMGGNTNRYMPFLFDDMVNGYIVQREVIEQNYNETKQKHFNGISIMLLNTLKTCLQNLFKINLNEYEKKSIIEKYISNENIKECILNVGAKKYFSHEYLTAIEQNDLDYLLKLGRQLYKKSLPRKTAFFILSKLPI